MRKAHVFVVVLVVNALAGSPAFAQSPLSLEQAIARARIHNPDTGIAAAAERAAAERVRQARGSYFPTLDLSESWQRGNHPVFAFSSHLAQRQFTAAGFALDAINRPAATDNFRTALSVEQALFDRGISANVRAAAIARDMAATNRQLVSLDLTASVTDAFGRVLIASAAVRSAAAAVETARADRELAGNRRDAGRVTDADVLQLDVYLAGVLERQARAISDEHIARAQLNQLIGEPLSTMFSIALSPRAVAIDTTTPAALEADAVKHRPEIALTRLQERLAAATVDVARAAFRPQVVAQGGWELNGGTWTSRSSSWVLGAVARINLFNGLSDKARLVEAREQVSRRVLETGKAETLVRLDVQIAIARLEAARASEAVGRAAADWARESHRIIRDRYESGLVDVAVLLRAADAVQQADTQQTNALVNVLTATAALQRAIGSL